jgi:hypothetical protein
MENQYTGSVNLAITSTVCAIICDNPLLQYLFSGLANNSFSSEHNGITYIEISKINIFAKLLFINHYIILWSPVIIGGEERCLYNLNGNITLQKEKTK